MSRFSLLSLFAAFPLISAQGLDLCSTGRFLNTQSDISEVAQCTRFTSYLAIDRNLRGEAVISGPQYIQSFQAGNPGASHSTPTLGPTYVEVIGLPDLVETESLRIVGAQYLRELRVPKLKSIVKGGLELGGDTLIKSLEFPSLERVDSYIYLSGIFDTINFSSLKTARALSITTTGSLDCVALFSQLKNINWTVAEADSKSVPTYQCTSSLNSYSSPLGFPYVTVPDFTSSSIIATSTFTSTISTNGSAIATQTGITTTTTPIFSATGGVIYPTGGSGSGSSGNGASGNGGSGNGGSGNGGSGSGGGVLPGGNNGTGIVTSKSTVTGPVPTALPTQLQSSEGNVIGLGKWASVVAVFALGLGL